MSQEAEVLLRTILYQLKNARGLDEAVIAVETMCSQETIAWVNEQVTASKALSEKKFRD